MDLWFPDVRTQKLAPRLIDNTGRFSSPFTRATRSISRGGDCWGFNATLNDLAGIDRARVESVLALQRGAANRIIFTPTDFPQRGSFPAGELFGNYNFAGSTTGWGSQANVALSAIDRGIRATCSLFDGTATNTIGPRQTVTLAQYAPYLVRFFVAQGRGAGAGPVIYNDAAADGLTGLDVTVFIGTAQASAFGALDAVRVPKTAGSYSFGLYMNATTGLAGDYYDVFMASCSRCAIVDNGANFMLNSDDFGTTWVQTSCTLTLNTLTDPGGTVTGDVLVESGATAEHYIQQTFTVGSAAVEYCAAVALKANGRNFAGVSIYEATGASYARGDFNLNTGATAGIATGANWANVRQFIAPLGNGWYYCAVVARKTNAATTIGMKIQAESAAGTISYAGSSAAATGMFRGTLAQSTFPMRLTPTAGSAIAGGLPQVGSSIYVKGLPVSTNDLLKPGDWFELNKEMKRVTNSLNSDAAGLGFLQFSPPIRTSPLYEDPVIINAPAGRFILSGSENGWEASPGGLIAGPRATYTLDLVEAA